MPSPELAPYLDTEAALKVDATALWRIVQALPEQLTAAEQECAKLKLPADWTKVHSVVCCGMGGSAIGAEVATDLPVGLKRKPVVLVRDYELPAWVGRETLAAVVSYSGDTEEALSCWREAQARGCPLFVVTGGGELKELSLEHPHYHFTYHAPPRDSFGYLFVPVLQCLVAAGVLLPAEADLAPALVTVQQLTATLIPSIPTPQNRAKQLAYQLYDRVPIIIGSALTVGVARRWKNQLNEHAKVASFAEPLPEANHNTVEGLGLPARFKDDAFVIILTTSFDHPEIQKRQRLLAAYLKGQGLMHEVVEGAGSDLWSEKLSLLALGDWVSYYLALLGRVDPEAIPAIAALKRKLRGG